MEQLLRRMEQSESEEAWELVRDELAKEGRAWEIHLGLFPLVQRVTNPPFINPHLPKMHGIMREFMPCLAEEDLPALLRLEINEYTRRPKSALLAKPSRHPLSVSFSEIETAIRKEQRERCAALMQAFLEQQGKPELARRLLLLGSDYLEHSLGHSVSCTAFILLEMIERSDQDPWPVLGTLAEYFCSGHFHTTAELRTTAEITPPAELDRQLLRATSGDGVVNLHHTITRYAIERVRHLLSEAEFAHLIACWIDFLGPKDALPPDDTSTAAPDDYESFYRCFSKQEEQPLLPALAGLIPSPEGRLRLGRYLIKGICDQYQGSYDPHFLTGLGSALWVVDSCREQPAIAMNALRQYLNFFFTRMES
ncbi:MAG: hypothetical protein H7Y05_14900 [Steroidobacteraceae bacterium]|nr:hypothetical protein [Deltaproteobacteria bacterium]